MRLLYIDPDLQAARKLHGELLDYRATNWSLTHCADTTTAVEQLGFDSYQVILYRSAEKIDDIIRELDKLISDAAGPPVVGLTEELTSLERLKLVASGCEDCLDRHETDGVSVMRSLRMAELRRGKFDKNIDASSARVARLFEVFEALEASSSQQQSISHADMPSKIIRVGILASGESQSANLLSDVRELRLDCIQDVKSFVERSRSEEESGADLGWDLLIVESSVFETMSDRDRIKLESQLQSLPSIVLTIEKSDYAALTYLQRGYTDCLIAEQVDPASLLLSIQKAIARYVRCIQRTNKSIQVGGQVKDRRSRVRSGADRRRHTRFYFEQPVVAIPILPNGAPDMAGRCEATTIDLSLSGMGVRLPNKEQLPQRNWILGVDQGHSMAYIHAFLRRVQYNNQELQAGLVFQNESDDFLSQQTLTPALQTETMRFDTKVSNEALEKWVELGVLSKQLSRRVRICPACSGSCTVAKGCKECGSFNTQFRDLIHHYACAHVSFEHEFKSNNSIECPKCLAKNIVAGADFEVIRSQYECSDCQHVGDVTVDVGCCLKCDLHFPIHLAEEIEVYGYDAERLDVLALIDSTR